MEELYSKGLNDPDSYDTVVTHVKPDILEWSLWAFGSIIIDKTSGGDGIQLNYFKS